MIMVEEPILSRLDRLDNIVRHLEEIRGTNHNSSKSSFESTPSSGTTLTSESGHVEVESSVDFSPKSLEKHCRPIDDVIVETEQKGTLIQRLMRVEDRVFKLCMQLEEELEAEKKRAIDNSNSSISSSEKKNKRSKMGLRHMIRSCVPGSGRNKSDKLKT